MASPVKDAKLKAQQIWAGATIHRRGKGSIVHRHPTNLDKFMADHQVGNVGWHFGDGPFTDAHEVDTAWVDAHPIDDAPWQKKMVLADYNAYAFREATHQFDQGQLIEYVHPASGEAINFEPMQLQWTNDLDQIEPIEDPQAVSATIVNDMLTWVDAYGSGIDFQWETQIARLMKYVNIDSLASLGAPSQFIIDGGNPVLRVELLFQKSANTEMWIDGVLWDEKSNNPQETFDNVEFRLAGQMLWYFRTPKAWDEEGEVSPLMRIRASAQNLFVEILTPWSWLETATYPVTIDATVEYTVGASADDSREINTNNSPTSIDAIMNSVGEAAGFRWQNVTIPDGSTIDAAYVTVTVEASPLRDDPVHDIDFQDTANPGAFTTATSYIGNLTCTTTVIDWSEVGILAGAHNTPELMTIIQELEDSYDYSGGEEMVCRMTAKQDGNLGLDLWDLSSSSTALLHIEYTESGGTVYEGTATLAGAATVVANADTVAAANATLAGVGTVTAAGTNARFGTSTLAGVGSLTAAGSNARLGTSTLAGVGTLVADGYRAELGTVTLPGVGTLTAAGENTRFVTATLPGVGTLAAVGTLVSGGETQEGAATLPGVATLSAVGENARLATSTLPGVGTLAAVGSRIGAGGTTLPGVCTLSAVGTLVTDAILGTATLAGVGSLSAVGTGSLSGTTTLSGVGSLTAVGENARFVATTLAGVGSLTAAGSNTRFVTTTLAGTGSLTAAGENTRFGLVTMAGVGTVVADAQLLANATVTLPGVGTLQATGTLITTYYGAATLSCVGTLQAIGTLLPTTPAKAGGDDEKEKPKQYEYQKEFLDMEPVARPLDPAFAMRQEQKSIMKANAVAESLMRQNEHEAARRVSAMLSREKADQDRADRRRASSLHNLAKAQIAKEAKAERQAEINKVRKKSLKKARAAKKRKAKKKK